MTLSYLVRYAIKFLGSQLSYLLERHQTRRNLVAFGRFLALLLATMVLFAFLFHVIMLYEGQDHSWITGLYWTMTVMSTLGFGDITFQSDLGRVYSMFVLVTGIVLLMIMLPFAFIRFFYAPWLEAQMRAQAPRELPPTVSGHILFASWDPVARRAAEQLGLLGIPFFVIEPDAARAAELKIEDLPVIRGDLDARSTWEAARVSSARAVFVGLDDATNTTVILTVCEAHPSTLIIALAENPESIDLLELAGARHVLPLKMRLGEQLAARVQASRRSIHRIGNYEELTIGEFPVIGSPFEGQTLREAGIRPSTGVNVVGLWERGRLVPARPDTVLEPWTLPVVVGTSDQMKALEERIQVEEGAPMSPVIVVGGGKVGRAAMEALRERHVPIHLIEHDPAVAALSQGLADRVFIGESANRQTLNEAGLDQAGAVVLTTNDDATNIYLSIYFRRLKPDLRIVARITHDRNIESIHRAGADFVLGYASLGQEHLLAIIQGRDFVFLGGDAEFFVLSLPVALVGSSLRRAAIGSRTSLNIVGIRQGGQLSNPGPDDLLLPGATLLAIGTAEQRIAFKKIYG